MSDKKWPPLREREWEISASEFADDERAFRNVHRNHRINGRLTSQIYEPSDDDLGCRSSAREKCVGAEKHFNEFTAGGNSSEGVCSVRLSKIEELDLRWIDDSSYVPMSTGHASIDFRRLDSGRKAKKLARELAKSANWEFPPEG